MIQLKSNDLFVSFRTEDRQFVTKLIASFKVSGLSSWNEDNAISPGSARNNKTVEQGIMMSHNFVFVMSPQSILSESCLFEIMTARKFKKPIVTVVAQKPTVEKENLYVPMALNGAKWIYFENAVYADKYSELLTELTTDKNQKQQHTQYLKESDQWKFNDKKNAFLVSGRHLLEAEQWLKANFENKSHFGPIYQQAEYICESRKYIEGGQTDIFFSYEKRDESRIEPIRKHVTVSGFTSWNKRSEIATICKFTHNIKDLIVQSDCFLFFMTLDSVHSDICIEELKLAQKYRKKIISIKLDTVPPHEYPNDLKNSPIIDLTVPPDSTSEVQLQYGLRNLTRQLRDNYKEHKLHKELLVRTKIWEQMPEHTSVLLKGFQLVNAERWLQTVREFNCCRPVPELESFINFSAEHKTREQYDAFFCYAKEDELMARRIRQELQNLGYNVWFDPIEIKDTTEIDPSTQRAIIDSNYIILLLSPEALASPYVKKEIRWALAWNKTLQPIMVEKVNAASLPKELVHYRILDGRISTGPITHLIEKITRQFNHNLEVVSGHTRWLRPAIEWSESGKSKDLLIETEEVPLALKWLEQRQNSAEEPFPVAQQADYINNSFKVFQQKQKKKKIIIYSAIAAVVFALMIIVNLNIQKNKAKLNYHIAGTQLLAFEAETTLEKDPTLSLRLAEAAYKFNSESPHTVRGLLKSYLANAPLYNKVYQSDKIIYSAYFSPDDRKILVATGENKAHLLDENGKLLNSFTHEDLVYSAKFSEDGRYILTVGQDELKIWSRKGDRIGSVDFKAELFDAAISPDGRTVALVGAGTKIKLYNFNGKQKRTIEAHFDDINLVQFSPSGKRLISLSEDGTIGVWSLNGKLVKRLSFEDTPKHCNFVGNDTTILIAGSHDITGVWSTSGKRVKKFPKRVDSRFILKNDQEFITADEDNVIRVWSAKSKLQNEFKGHTAQLRTLDIDSKGLRLLSASGRIGERDNSARLWQCSQAPTYVRFKREAINSAAYTPDGKYFAIASGSEIELFDSEGIPQKTFTTQHDIADIAFMADGGSVFVAHENKLITQYTREGKQIRKLKSEHSSVSSIDVSPDGRFLISSGTDEVVVLWDLSSGTNMPIVAHKEAITHVKYSSSGDRFLTVSEDSTAKVWDSDGELQLTLKKHKAPLLWADFSPNGEYIVTTGLDNAAYIWNEDGEIIQEFEQHTEAVTSACFSKDNKYIVTTAHDNTSQFWTIQGEPVYTIEGKGILEQHNLAVFSPDGKHLLIISRDITNAGIVSIFSISPQSMIENINNQNLLGKIWELDQQTKKQYYVLE